MSAITLGDIGNYWSGSAYNSKDAEYKAKFHRVAAKQLRAVATLLGLPPGSYDVRSNKAGIAVSGEVTLHTERVYVQVGYFAFDRSPRILYRTCKGRKDYTGGHNNYLPGYVLDTPAEMVEACRRIGAA